MQLTQQQYDQLIQKGLTPDQVKTLAQSRGDSLPTEKRGAITNFAVGAVKGATEIATDTARGVHMLGQGIQAAIDPTRTFSQVREEAENSFGNVFQGANAQGIDENLKARNTGEKVGKVAANVASFFIPTSPVIRASGTALKTGGRILTRAGIGLSSKEAPLVQAYRANYTVPQRIWTALSGKNIGRPITNAETAVKNAIFGTESMIGVQSKRAATKIWSDVISPALKGSTEKINMTSFIDEIAAKIDEIPELTRQGELKTALQAFADDYGKVGEVTLEKLQQFKEGWAKFLPDKVYKNKPIAASFREIQRIAASLARNKIYTAVKNPEVKAAYFDYGNLKNLQEFGQKAMTGSKLKGGAGSFISGIYDKIVTPIATTAGMTLYKTGEGLEFVGRAGAKILGDLFR